MDENDYLHGYAYHTQNIVEIDIDIFAASGHWRTDIFITGNNGLLDTIFLEYYHYFAIYGQK